MPQRPVVLVTGSAQRIGLAIAQDLTAHGWDVAVHCRHCAAAEAYAADLADLADLADQATCDSRVAGPFFHVLHG